MGASKATHSKKPTSAKAAAAQGKSSTLASLKTLVFGKAPKSGKAVAKEPHKTAIKAPAKAVAPVKSHSAKVAPAKPAANGKSPRPNPKANGKSSGMVAFSASVSVTATAAQIEAAGESVCREVACENLATTGGYCRLHYIKNWKKIKRKEVILREKKLNQYIEELVAKYPDKYIEAIRQDLASDKDFAKVISDLDLDESVDDFDGDGENVDNLIDSIKRDFDDESEGF